MDGMFVFAPKLICGNPKPHGDSLGRWCLWKLIRTGGWSPHKWNWCPYERDKGACPHCHMRTRGQDSCPWTSLGGLRDTLNPPTP